MEQKRPWWSPRVILVKLITIAVLVYAGLTLLLAVCQTWIIFPASREVFRDPGHYGWEFETVWLDVNGERTHAWWVPAENPRGVALFSHGNAGNIANRLESIGLLMDMGLSVFVYDYGGYGESTGSPSEQRCYADATAAYNYLTEARGIAAEEILLFGRSLGAAVTIDLAARVPAAAAVIESSFASVRDMARSAYPFLYVGPFIRHRFDNLEKIGRVEAPKLFIHSPDDDIVPYSQGRKLFDAAPEPKTFLDISGGHNEGFIESFTVYQAGWERFLEPILPRPEEQPQPE